MEDDHEQKFPTGSSSSTNRNNHQIVTSKRNLPPGYRFVPTDYELCFHLQNKITNGRILIEEIKEIDLYKTDPKTLSEMYPPLGEKEWYFFTSRHRKYPNGERPDRRAGGGYWKASGADKPVDYKGKIAGSKKTLVFYLGKHQEGVKTNWIMHEFKVDQSPPSKRDANDMKLDDWVLCRIYERVSKLKGNEEQADEGNHHVDESTRMNSQVEGVTNTQIQIVHNNQEDLAAALLVNNHDNNGNLAAVLTSENIEMDQELRGLRDFTNVPSYLDNGTPDWAVPTNIHLSHTVWEKQALMSLEQGGVFQEEGSYWPVMENHEIIHQLPRVFDQGNFHHPRMSDDGTLIHFHQQGVPSYLGNFHQHAPSYYMASNPDYDQLMPRKKRR